MSKAGERILKSARQALAFARGETTEGFVVHVPKRIDVKAIRQGLGLTQEAFSRRFGFAIGTLRDWEQGRAQPDRAARILLRVIEREPKAVDRALEHV